MKEQKNKKTFPFFFLAAVISCVNIFLPFPLPFILDIVCQIMINDVSYIDQMCQKNSSFVLLPARLWLGCCCPNLRWARFGRRLMAGAFSSFLPVQNDLLWFSREIYIP